MAQRDEGGLVVQTGLDGADEPRRAGPAGRWVTPALAWTVVAASVALGAAVVGGWVTTDPGQATLVGTVIGYLFGESKQVLTYYFGSSAGSAEKTRILAGKD